MANMINSKAPLSGLAKLMAMKGRKGDTQLAHINPMEAKMLEAMGGAGTINPSTGLKEYYEGDDDTYSGDDFGGMDGAGQSSSTGGVGPSNNDFGGSNQDWVDAYNDQFNTPSTPTLPSSEGPKTTAQIVDDWYSNPYNATGITSVEQMRGRDAYNANPFDAYDPSGPDAFGSGNFKGLDSLASIAKFGLGFTPLAPAVAAYSMGTGLYDASSPKDNKDTKGVDESKGDKSISNIPGNLIDNAKDKYNSTVDTISGLGGTLSKTSGDLWGSLVDVVAGDYIGTSGAAGINNGKDMYAGASMLPDDVADARAIGDGSALFGGTAFTPEQNESAFGDSGGSTERKKQMRYVQQRAQAPDATPEEVLRWKQVSNPDYTYTPEAMGTYAERGGPSHFKMVQANTGGGLSDLYNMSEGGTFSGMVKGPDGGDGMSDDVAFNIKDEGQGGPDKALLSKDEYVIDAHSMSLLGNGSSDAGADQMDKFIKDLRKSGFGTTKQPKQLDGAEELSKLL